jgi:hypothetical protein
MKQAKQTLLQDRSSYAKHRRAMEVESSRYRSRVEAFTVLSNACAPTHRMESQGENDTSFTAAKLQDRTRAR